MMIEHVDLATPHSYERATARFKELVPPVDPHELAGLVARKAPAADVEAMMKRRAGELGILIMTQLDQGPVVSLIGAPRKLALYVIGSPFLGAKLFAEHRAAGLYAPAHVTLYEHEDGFAHLAYDTPSTLLAQFGAAAAELGKMFDAKLAALGQALSSQFS
ncbi:MAG: DUF302 domain-containing protein [Kofleriaceae bacterium]